MLIARIVDSEGSPFSSETSYGNRTDVSKTEAILRMVERKYGKARRIWAFDCGIMGEDNLAAIRKRGGQYLFGAPRCQMKRLEARLLKDDWTALRLGKVGVKQIAIPGGGETSVLCGMHERKEKENAIRKRFSTRVEAALRSLAATIETDRLKDRSMA